MTSNMEKRIKERINSYTADFKDQLLHKIDNNSPPNELKAFIQTFRFLELTKDDFAKRKRVKNIVPFY